MKSRDQKRTEGQERNEDWSKLTPTEQLASLDRRLGKGVGAKRQRAKLEVALAPAVSAPETGKFATFAPKVERTFASKSEERRVKYMQQKKSA